MCIRLERERERERDLGSGGLTWMQSRAVLIIRGTLLLQASSKGLKYLSALTRPPGNGRASDSDLLWSACVCVCVCVCVDKCEVIHTSAHRISTTTAVDTFP